MNWSSERWTLRRDGSGRQVYFPLGLLGDKVFGAILIALAALFAAKSTVTFFRLTQHS